MLSIDLHCHSDRSDGALSPTALIYRAAARGVRVLALTDHDTLAGLDAATDAAKQHGVELIGGVEISVTWHGRTLHVVGLNVDPQAAALSEGLARLCSGRRRRAVEIGDRLDAMGVRGALDAATRLASNPDQVGRTHFARHLVACGAASDVKSAFRRYLAEGRAGYVRHQWASLPDAVAWIRQARGMAVLAHPGRYGLRSPRLRSLFAEFRALGGDAVEVLTASHGPEQVDAVSRVANESGLLASAGSDFHAPDESWLDLGQLPELPASCQPIWRAWTDRRAAFVQ
ncbi:MAG: PHP domain-containing protein [Burkholderiales bacterium]|nr:PHP domain-containing protein [Burkholderiales bacterium]